MKVLAVLSKALVLVDLNGGEVNFSANVPVFVVRSPTGYVLVDPTTGVSGLLGDNQDSLMSPGIQRDEPNFIPKKKRSFIVGHGTDVFLPLPDGKTFRLNGELFLTCSEDVLHIYRSVDGVIQKVDTPIETVKYGSRTNWWQTNLLDPFCFEEYWL